MKHLDLGKIDGPITLFGGPYSNLQALQEFLIRAGSPNLICTGDVVAYGANPVECIALLRSSDCVVVAGNCEKQLSARAESCGCGFEEGSACDLLSRGWYPFANAQVTQDDRDWMGALPDVVTFEQSEKRFAVIHGGITDISRFLWNSSPVSEFRQEIAALTVALGPIDGVIAGHSGLAFERKIGRVHWINAGVIGMPENNGRTETRYAILDRGTVQFHNLSYDHDAACAAMQSAGLTQGYDKALVTGYWPSEDVLPADLRKGALDNG